MQRRRLEIAFLVTIFAAIAVSVSACGGHSEPATPAASADAVGASGGAEGRPHRQRKPFAIHSSCSEVVTVVFGEDAKAPGADRRTVAPNAASDGPRDGDGNQTVWLLDSKGEPTVKVRITRGMKQLEIGRSCSTLDAH